MENFLDFEKIVDYEVRDKKIVVCFLTSRLDTDFCLKWEEKLWEKVFESRLPITFNMENVEYVSSSFLSACLRIFQKVGSGNFLLNNLRPGVRKVFKLAAFDELFGI